MGTSNCASATAAMLSSLYVLGFYVFVSFDERTLSQWLGQPWDIGRRPAHVHLVPTGSVNDPGLASQEQSSRKPEESLGWAGAAPGAASPGHRLKTKEMQLTCLLSSGAFRKSALITAMV